MTVTAGGSVDECGRFSQPSWGQGAWTGDVMTLQLFVHTCKLLLEILVIFYHKFGMVMSSVASVCVGVSVCLSVCPGAVTLKALMWELYLCCTDGTSSQNI